MEDRMRVLWLAAGAAIGYVFGTKAGRERYEQIKATAADWADKPAVADTVATVGALADRGKDAVAAKVATATDKVKDTVTTKVAAATDKMKDAVGTHRTSDEADATTVPRPVAG
jgi:hypothetical protein